MSYRRSSFIAFAPAFALALGATFAPRESAAGVQWDPSSVRVGGTGCGADTATLTLSNGTDFDVVFTQLGVDLEGAGAGTSDSRTCTVALPATVDARTYPSLVAQSVTYGIQKSASASASLTSPQSTFFGFPLSLPLVSAPFGSAINVTSQVATRSDSIAPGTTPYANWCRASRPTSGQLVANLVAAGSRSSAADYVIAFVVGAGLRWEFQTAWQSC